MNNQPTHPNLMRDLKASLDAMEQANRQLGESRMIRTATPPEEVTDHQSAAVIEAVKAYMKEKKIKQAQIARSLILTPSVISQVLSGTYAADPGPIIMAMDRWLERRKAADSRPQTFQYVETAVAKQIRVAARHAIKAADAGIDARIALVWSDAGYGKTMALEALVDSDDAILITCGVDVTSARAILEKIGEALRVPLGRSAREAFEEIVNRLRGSGKLIIVDEIHALLDARDDSAFHTLRRLSDKTGCPQLWAATCDLIKELDSRQRRHESLAQITSRIGAQFHLTASLTGISGDGTRSPVAPLFSVEEVLQIFASNELKLTRDAGKFLARMCLDRRRGGLRTCTSLVACATEIARGEGAREISRELLWRACQFLFQQSVLLQIARELREELQEMKLKIA